MTDASYERDVLLDAARRMKRLIGEKALLRAHP